MPLHRIHAGRHLHPRNSALGKRVHPAVESQSRSRFLGKSRCLWLAAQVNRAGLSRREGCPGIWVQRDREEN